MVDLNNLQVFRAISVQTSKLILSEYFTSDGPRDREIWYVTDAILDEFAARS